MPPARPTMPETAPVLAGKSSLMCLNVDAIPHAKDMPSTKRNTANAEAGRPMWNDAGSRMV